MPKDFNDSTSLKNNKKRYFFNITLDFKLNCKIFLCLGLLKHEIFVSSSIRYSNTLHADFMTLMQLAHTYSIHKQFIHAGKIHCVKMKCPTYGFSKKKKNPTQCSKLSYTVEIPWNKGYLPLKATTLHVQMSNQKNVLGNMLQTYQSIHLSKLI